MSKRMHVYLALIFTFLIGNHKGFIALWTDNGKDPAVVFPYSVASLPTVDQAALEKGIEIQSMDQLNRLLEDYLS